MYVKGAHNVICDRCGFKFKSYQTRMEWTGLRVCTGEGSNDCWEPRHPQDFKRAVRDRQAVRNPRPEQAWAYVDTQAQPAITLSNQTTSLAEDADTSSATKLADITIANNYNNSTTLYLTGDGSGNGWDEWFQLSGTELQLKAGVSLDFEMFPSLDVTINANTPILQPTPNDTEDFTLTITDVAGSSTVFQDSFTEAGNTALQSHTPDTGTGWTIQSGSITVIAATNTAEGQSTNDSDRANADSVGGVIYDVLAEFDNSGATGEPLIGWGVGGRHTSATARDGFEFKYGSGNFSLTNFTSLNEDATALAWPGDNTWMKLEIRSGVSKGYYSTDGGSSWTEVCSLSEDPNSSNGYFPSLTFFDFNGTGSPAKCYQFQVDVPT